MARQPVDIQAAARKAAPESRKAQGFPPKIPVEGNEVFYHGLTSDLAQVKLPKKSSKKKTGVK